jgi:hypothetical protein
MAVIKITKGSDFRGLLDYLSAKEGAEFWGGNMAGTTPKELAREFRLHNTVRNPIKQPVCHISISLSPHERPLNKREWKQLAREFLFRMGFERNQYCVYRHTDGDHPHIHLVVSRIDLATRKVISDSYERYRAADIMRSLERTYALFQLSPVSKKAIAPLKTGEVRYQRRTGRLPQRSLMQEEIAKCLRRSKDLSAFRAQLVLKGIFTNLKCLEKKVVGISYSTKDAHFAGYQLGQNFTYQTIERQLNANQKALSPSLSESGLTSPPELSAGHFDIQQQAARATHIAEVARQQELHQARQQIKKASQRGSRWEYERLREDFLNRYPDSPTEPRDKFDMLLCAFALSQGMPVLKTIDAIAHGDGTSPISDSTDEAQETHSLYAQTIVAATLSRLQGEREEEEERSR